MANYVAIRKLRPGFDAFISHYRVMHRGDVLFFPSNVRSDLYTTDHRGFRHTSFGDETLSVADVLNRDRYGLVLGGSRAFGHGVQGNANTMPSLLSQHFGFPFANVALYQGNSRNLFSLLNASLAKAAKAPAAVIHFSGGDFGSFCCSGIADPVFGSPNPKLLPIVQEERGSAPSPEKSLPGLLEFTTLWTRSIARLCQAFKVPLVLVHDTSFFEKREPSARDRETELGTAHYAWEKRWFRNHRAFADHFYERRAAIAAKLGVPLAGPLGRHDLTFIDEFHYDEDGIKSLTSDVAVALKPLLKA